MTPRLNENSKVYYGCDKCEKIYTARSSLYSHKKAKHNESLPPVSIPINDNEHTEGTDSEKSKLTQKVVENDEDMTGEVEEIGTHALGNENEDILNMENENMARAKEDQDLYDELDKLSQDISSHNEDVQTVLEVDELLNKINRFKVILQKKNELEERTRKRVIEVEKANGLLEKETQDLKKEIQACKDKCSECPKRAQVEANLSHLLNNKDKEVDNARKEIKNLRERNIAILKESKKKKIEVNGIKKEKDKLVKEIGTNREVIESLTKKNNELNDEVIVNKELVKSLKEIHGMENVDKDSDNGNNIMSNDSTENRCLACDKTFKANVDLEKHIKAKHETDCPLCGTIFKNRNELKKHITRCMDSNISIHKCEVCSEEFSSRNDLNTHKQAKHSGTKFVCSMCGLKNNDETNLRQHLREEHMFSNKSVRT